MSLDILNFLYFKILLTKGKSNENRYRNSTVSKT